jgi:Aminomethyltransferase folate-binding domain
MPSLEEEINAAGGPLPLMRSGRSGVFPFPIKSEFTNWRDEQESWRTTAALMDLSHHMADLTVDGPDCYRLLSDLGANSFKGFGAMRAKQFSLRGGGGKRTEAARASLPVDFEGDLVLLISSVFPAVGDSYFRKEAPVGLAVQRVGD